MFSFFTTSFLEYPDNSSLAAVVSMTGCTHNCVGCHSPITRQDPEEYLDIYENIKDGIYYRFDNFDIFCNSVVQHLSKHNTNTLVITGGDPFFINNREFTIKLIKKLTLIKKCIYSGFTIECVKGFLGNEVIPNTIYKCGTYNVELKQKSYKDDDKIVLASTNQNFYNEKFKQLSNNGVYEWI